MYQQLENHVLQPLIIGRAVRLSPPATMVAALVGVAAGGLVGGLFAIPLLGATKAIYLVDPLPGDRRRSREPEPEAGSWRRPRPRAARRRSRGARRA